MTIFVKATIYIVNCQDANLLYDGLREILTVKRRRNLKDDQLKQLLQLADAKYEELKRKAIMEKASEEANEHEKDNGQLLYLIQRAKNHTENFMYQNYKMTGREVPEVPDIVYKAMVVEFLDRQEECNISTYEIWQEIVCDFLDDAA